MTRDEIISMAREAGFEPTNFVGRWDVRTDELIEFAALVAARERERCIAACELMRPSEARGHPVNEAVFAAAIVAVDSCIEAIRSRADHEVTK